MLKILTMSIVLVLLSGCTSKEEKVLMNEYQKNKFYHKKLQKTEKIQLYAEGSTKILLTMTYLYEPLLKKEENLDEVFVLGMYVEESDIQDFNQEDFVLTLGGERVKSIKTLERKSPYLKDISFISQWSQFYLVHFPHTTKKSFKLKFESEEYGRGEFYFAKVAKYVFTKEGF